MWADAQLDGRRAEYSLGDALFQRRKVWLTPNTRLPCSNAAKTRMGAPNHRTDLSRQWAEVYHIVGTSGGDITA